MRELWGKILGVCPQRPASNFQPKAGRFEAVGDTDSEALFCDILNQLDQRLNRHDHPKFIAETLAVIAKGYAKQGVLIVY